MSNGSSSSNATLILVLGILGIVCLPFLAPIAWVMGNNALKELDQGIGDPNTRGTIVAGRILGIIGTGLLILTLMILCFYVVLIVALFGAAGGRP